jgi:hypothetical protein
MAGSDYSTFYAASAGAGAALIGLLFVSVSISPEATVQAGAPWERRAAAESAFTALVNAFFVSLGALLPDTNLGSFAVITSGFALLTCVGLAVDLVRERRGWPATARRATLILAALAAYGFELANGLTLLRHSSDPHALNAVATIVLCVYALGLVRAWELLGAQRYGIVSRLSPLRSKNGTTSATGLAAVDAAAPQRSE